MSTIVERSPQPVAESWLPYGDRILRGEEITAHHKLHQTCSYHCLTCGGPVDPKNYECPRCKEKQFSSGMSLTAERAETVKRDPKLDPQPGDVLVKPSAKSDKVSSRKVTKREGFEITYVDHTNTERKSWITSWQEWARMAELPGQDASPHKKAIDLILKRVASFPPMLTIKSASKDSVSEEELVNVLRSEIISADEIVRAFRSSVRAYINAL